MLVKETQGMQGTTGTFGLEDVRRALGPTIDVRGNEQVRIRKVAPLHETSPETLGWIRAENKRKQALCEASRAGILICDDSVEVDHLDLRERCVVRVKAPEIAFMRIVKAFYAAPLVEPGIHATAYVHPRAKLGVGVSVGAFSYVGPVEIGDGTTIEHHVNVREGSVVGRNVRLCDHVNVGGQGFGHVANEHGVLENMLHVGQVILEDDVELFPYTNADRATLSETRIERGAKIDHYCHVGHNTRVGAAAILAAKVVLCGGAKVGSRAWVGVGTIVRDLIEIGDGAILGMGSVVTKTVPAGETWAGSPARRMDELRALQARFADLLKER